MISEIREQIERELSRVFPRFRKKKLSLLALEIVWVSVQLRTATLIDSFLLSSDEANILGDALQRVDTNITVAHEPYSGQTLVVNRKILSSRTPQDTVFIEVGGRYPQILSTPPEPFRELLSQVTAASPSATFVSLSLPDPDRPQDLIPLVGHLLDYKIAYTLGASSEGGANCLGGTELFLVEASVQIEQGEPQRLLSFSYPSSLVGQDTTLNPASICRILQEKLRSRIARYAGEKGARLGCSVEVGFRTVELDQVAL